MTLNNVIKEYIPDKKLADELFDYLPKTDNNWNQMVATVCLLLAQVYMAGSEDKPKKIDVFVAFPESTVLHKQNKGYKITIEQTEG